MTNPDPKAETTAPIPEGIDATRRELVIRALQFAAHGHGELPSGFMSDAVDCLTGVLRECESRLLSRLDETRATLALLRDAIGYLNDAGLLANGPLGLIKAARDAGWRPEGTP